MRNIPWREQSMKGFQGGPTEGQNPLLKDEMLLSLNSGDRGESVAASMLYRYDSLQSYGVHGDEH